MKVRVKTRRTWADFDPHAGRQQRLQVYDSKADQRANRPDLKPFRVAVVPIGDPDELFRVAYAGFMKGAKGIEGGVRGVLRAIGCLTGPERNRS